MDSAFWIEHNTEYEYDDWSDFLADKPWETATHLFEIPVYYSIQNKDHPLWDDEALILVYIEPIPLKDTAFVYHVA